MTVEIFQIQEDGSRSAQPACLLLPHPPEVRRTKAQKMLILAHLTVAMIELNVEGQRNGNA